MNEWDQIQAQLARMPTEEAEAFIGKLDAQSRLMLREALESHFFPDTPDGFASFFKKVSGYDLLPHSREQVEGLYRARAEGKFTGIEAFRGSAKTTVLVAFFAFRIGKEPHKANLLVQVGDDIATDNAGRVADIIAYNPGWREAFPDVVPDYEKGWGAQGYEVKRTDIPYEEWRQICSERKDPSFLGVGYHSRTIIGKRPDGILLIDDILDYNNTASEKEMAAVDSIITGTIFPSMTPDTWLIFVYTPWKEDDPVVKQTRGENFYLIKTPVFVPCDKADCDGVDFEGERVKLTWPGRFSVGELLIRKTVSGIVEFSRMYLLDLSKTNNTTFKYQLYPSHAVNALWVMVGGIDYAGTIDPKSSNQTDWFALCYVAKHPEGGAVVVDGVLERCTQSQAEEYALRAQEIFPNWQIAVVEGDGKGEEFVQVMMRHPSFKLLPLKTGGHGKNERLVIQMSPWLESGRVRISDGNSPFLNELRKELDQFPFCAHDDALDALYWALRAIPDVLQVKEAKNSISGIKKKRANPFSGLGKQ